MILICDVRRDVLSLPQLSLSVFVFQYPGKDKTRSSRRGMADESDPANPATSLA